MNTKEKTKIKEFVNKYKEIQMSIELMQKSIESLVVKRDNLFIELDSIKKDEETFMNKLINKYGANEITPYKLLQIYEEDL